MGWHKHWNTEKLSLDRSTVNNVIHTSLRWTALLLGIVGMGSGAIAPPASQAVNFPSSTPSEGAPPRTASGAPRRNACTVTQYADRDQDGSAETALSPMTMILPFGNVIKTADSQLTFVVYLPQNTALSAQLEIEAQQPVFVLDNNGNPVLNEQGQPQITRYETTPIYLNNTLPIPGSVKENGPRLVTYHINDLDLEPGITYIGRFGLLCGTETPFLSLNDFELQFELHPIGLDPLTLFTADPSQLVSMAQNYAKRGFWDETIQLTTQLRQAQPDQWQALLESQGLGCLATVPFANDAVDNFTIDQDPLCFVDQD